MDQRLNDVLTGGEANYLLPFLWMRDGQGEARLRELVGEVHQSGARAVCLESRTYEQFCADAWWADLDVVLDEAERRGMKVWILDDKHFPTGYANGVIASKYPERRRWQLLEEHVDMVGPMQGAAMLLCGNGQPEDVLLGVYAYPRTALGEQIAMEPVNLTSTVRGRYAYFDVPKGIYRVFALYKSRRGTRDQDYIHMIDPESVDTLIEAVYEPHWARFKDRFGTTIAGFFSDEPSLGNSQLVWGGASASMYDQKLGQPGLALPWTEELLFRLTEKLGRDPLPELVGLWHDTAGGSASIRLAYMDVMTNLWRESFSLKLGGWCRDHGVEYIGHIIEDMNAHARLSCSGGHYFRALDGQDMAGIDVVLHQMIPGIAHHKNAASCAGGFADPAFFQYVLANLAASHAHINPRMRGRAMCEVFGAFGWAFGVPMMKWLMDHLLVRGVNHFVPHAFSPSFPDPDCPPHFSGGGQNPQFEAFGALMRYANQVSHLLSGGKWILGCGLLYHAEAEWSGEAYMLVQEPCVRLLDAQVNYCILPIDAIVEQGRMEGGVLVVGDVHCPALVVPYAKVLPETLLKKLGALQTCGLKLAFVCGRPDGFFGGDVISLDDVADWVRVAGGADLTLDGPFDMLRYYHAVRGETHVFMVVNESMSDAFDSVLHLPVSGRGVRLDLLLDRKARIEAPDGLLSLALDPGQSTILVFGGALPDAEVRREADMEVPMDGHWTLSTKQAEKGANWTPPAPLHRLYDIAGADGDNDFSGLMRYEIEFVADDGLSTIELGRVGEVVRGELNGVDLGWRICAPYQFDVRNQVKPGRNHLVLTVANNLVHAVPDGFSRFLQIAPSGLLGPVRCMMDGRAGK